MNESDYQTLISVYQKRLSDSITQSIAFESKVIVLSKEVEILSKELELLKSPKTNSKKKSENLEDF